MYVNESPKRQTPQESVAYTITTTPWGSSPSGVTLTVYDVTVPGVATDVSNTVTSGSNTVSADVITTKFIEALTLGRNYRADVLFTDSNNNDWEAQFDILCRAA